MNLNPSSRETSWCLQNQRASTDLREKSTHKPAICGDVQAIINLPYVYKVADIFILSDLCSHLENHTSKQTGSRK